MISPETLRRFPLFAGQSLYMLDEIAMISEEIDVRSGEWLFQEDEQATKLYLVLEGAISLTIYLFLNGRGTHIEAMEPLTRGEVVGWSCMIQPNLYTLGAKAEKDSRLVVINALPLAELFDDNPVYGYYFMKKLAEVIGDRLNRKCIQLLSMVLDSENKPIRAEA